MRPESIKARKIQKYIEKSSLSNVAKSSRRIIFTHLEQGIEERGFYHVDSMFGAGSGILIKYDDTFFLLTAKHVIENNIGEGYQNESPFWIPSRRQLNYENYLDFLFPKKMWDIFELIPEYMKDSALVDIRDICLVELFYPQKDYYPDNYIELESTNSIVQEHDFFDGQFLICSGYPFDRNTFDHEFRKKHYTHATEIHRCLLTGIYISDSSYGHISFNFTEGEQHKNMDGMSGGVVCNVQEKGNKVKLAGLIVSAGNKICRFIPAYVFIESILNYKQCSSHLIDPIAELENM